MPLSGKVTNDLNDLPCPTSPPCWPLLTQPQALLNNPQSLPTHLCVEMLDDSARIWYDQAVTLLTGHLVPLWPIPIGQHLAQGWGWLRNGGRRVPSHTVVSQMPFPDDELALLALRIPLPGGLLDLFGLGDEHADPTGGSPPWWSPQSLVAVVKGPPSLFPQATDLIQRADRWWTSLYLIPVRRQPGRPPGSGTLDKLTLEDLRAAYRQARQQQTQGSKRKHLTAEKFGEALPSLIASLRGSAVGRDTISRRLKDDKLTWKRFVASCD